MERNICLNPERNCSERCMVCKAACIIVRRNRTEAERVWLAENLESASDDQIADVFADAGVLLDNMAGEIRPETALYSPWIWARMACNMTLEAVRGEPVQKRVHELSHHWVNAMRADCANAGYPVDELLN